MELLASASLDCMALMYHHQHAATLVPPFKWIELILGHIGLITVDWIPLSVFKNLFIFI